MRAPGNEVEHFATDEAADTLVAGVKNAAACQSVISSTSCEQP